MDQTKRISPGFLKIIYNCEIEHLIKIEIRKT